MQIGAGGCGGIGLVIDAGGDDSYTVPAYGIGFGSSENFTCADEFGNGPADRVFRVLPIDVEPFIPWEVWLVYGSVEAIAVGMLIDVAGNDTYSGWEDPDSSIAETEGLAAFGVLFDGAGVDSYSHGVVDGGGPQVRGMGGIAIDLP